MELILLLVRIFLFAVFITAGIGKLFDLEGSEKAVKAFGVPESLAKPFSILLPAAEIFFALLLLFTTASWFGALGTFLLLAVFIGGMIYQMAQGNAPDCHCFGAIHSEPVSKKSLIRNIVFAILALFLAANGRENQGLSFSDITNDMALQLILGLALVGMLGAVIYYLKQISEQQNQIMRRIEVLELVSHEGAEIKRDDVETPADGLPIGAPIPDFIAQDVKGKEVAFEHLLMKAKPMLFFFVSPTCSPCAALLPEIQAWKTELKDKLNIVFISSGKAKDNIAKFGENEEILLQKDKEIIEIFRALWTPSAVLINPDGTIASRLVTGDSAIRELIESIKSTTGTDGMLYAPTPEIPNAKQIGVEISAFSANDISGRNISSAELKGKRTLVTYWSLDCGWCGKMLDDLREWDKTRGLDEPDLLLVSSGEAEKHRELGLRGTILLDNELALSKNLGMTGTPSAILVNEDGRIASEVAVGAQQIWALLGKKV